MVVEEEVVVEDVVEGEEDEAFAEEMPVKMSDNESVEAVSVYCIDNSISMVISFTPHPYLTSPQATKIDVICEECADLLIFKEPSNRSEKCCCRECDVEEPELHLSQSQSSASSVVSSSLFSSSGRPKTFKCLFADSYPCITRNDRARYLGRKQSKNERIITSSCGSGQVARLELLCLLLARSSTINEDGTVTWSGVEQELVQPLKQFMRELQKDVELLKKMVDDQARKHLQREDIAEGDNDVVETALRYVATLMDNGVDPTKIRSFGLKQPVMKKIAQELRSIADNYDEDVEFPWLGGSEYYPFPNAEKWREQSKKLKRKLANVETLDHRVSNICIGLESVMAFFGCEQSPQGTRGQRAAPQIVTKANEPRRKMADFSLAALFEGLLCDPVVDNEDFCEFVLSEFEKDPTRLSKNERMEALLLFLRKIKAIPEWYFPSFLRVFDGDLDASTDEVRKMKEVFKELIGDYDNLKRIREERQQEKDMVRMNVCLCFYIHFLAITLNIVTLTITLFKGG
eukprot:scaffold29520_cov78-Skeletonema_dohrnii-CCMP3373.AAC.1